MTLQNIFLQTDAIQQFNDFASGLFGNDIAQAYLIIAVAIVLGLGGFGGFYLYKVWKAGREFVGEGLPVGEFEIMWAGHFAFKGNVSISDALHNQDYFEQIKQLPNMTKGIEEIELLVKDKKIFVYDMKITDFDERADISKENNVLLVSSAPIQSDDYSYQDEKGQLRFGATRRQYTRIVLAHHTSERYEIPTPDGNWKECFIIAPIPIGEVEEIVKIGFDDKNFLPSSYQLKVINLPNKKDIATVASFMETLSEAYKQIRVKEVQTENLQKMLEEEQIKNVKLRYKLNNAYHLLQDQQLIGKPFKDIPREPRSFLMWVIGSIALGALTIWIVQSTPQLQEVPEWMAVAIVMGIVYAFIHFTKRDDTDDEELNLESEAN